MRTSKPVPNMPNIPPPPPRKPLTPRQAFAAAFITGMHSQLQEGWHLASEDNLETGRRSLAREAWAFADAMIAEEKSK